MEHPAVPSFALKMMLGEQAALVLDSLKVSSEKLQRKGFQFLYADCESALNDLLEGWKNGVSVKIFEQYFDLPRQRVFQFFSQAVNLEKITPDFLRFRVERVPRKNRQRYAHRLQAHLHGSISWRTRIDSWSPESFSDTQISGPTAWHHTHRFEDLGGGTLMTDIIRYKLPLGMPGRLVAQGFVDNDVDKIFNFRREIVGKYL